MDPVKIGMFLRKLRKEKELTQEQFAQEVGVSNRTVSRWENGTNMPDISLLVQIADFYEVDVRELIEGERKSETMDKEVRDVATKMADYASAEKSRLLKTIQGISLLGDLILVLSIIWKITTTDFNSADRIFGVQSIYISVLLLVIMAVITLYVTGALEKIMKNRILYTGIKVVTISGIVLGALYLIVLPTVAIGMLIFSSVIEHPQVYEDVNKYNEYMSFSREETYDDEYYKWDKFGMDETIWPAQITADMSVEDFTMVYYNPWDKQYLGYLVVDYKPEDYEKEVERLREYDSSEYVGYYGVEAETSHELLAVNADEYHGFVYALTDGNNRIIYAEQLFCNYFMDLDYTQYMPQEYLLDGFNARQGNPYRSEQLNEKTALQTSDISRKRVKFQINKLGERNVYR